MAYLRSVQWRQKRFISIAVILLQIKETVNDHKKYCSQYSTAVICQKISKSVDIRRSYSKPEEVPFWDCTDQSEVPLFSSSVGATWFHVVTWSESFAVAYLKGVCTQATLWKVLKKQSKIDKFHILKLRSMNRHEQTRALNFRRVGCSL